MFWDFNLLGLSDTEYEIFCERAEEWFKEYKRRGYDKEWMEFRGKYPLDFDCTCGAIDIELHSDNCIVGRCVKYRKRYNRPLIRHIPTNPPLYFRDAPKEAKNWQKNLPLPKNKK